MKFVKELKRRKKIAGSRDKMKFTQTWQEIEADWKEEAPRTYEEFQEMKKILIVDKVRIREIGTETILDYYSEFATFVERKRINVIFTLKNRPEKYRFTAHYEPIVGKWVTIDTEPIHLSKECCLCEKHEYTKAGKNKVCRSIHIEGLRYVLDQVIKHPSARLELLFG